ncbi:MAG: SBBP repeat-containing protein [Ignavibacteriae bacterium]|nr:SBBP repeat-containing protein [Ignavibacteriota bacterium]
MKYFITFFIFTFAFCIALDAQIPGKLSTNGLRVSSSTSLGSSGPQNLLFHSSIYLHNVQNQSSDSVVETWVKNSDLSSGINTLDIANDMAQDISGNIYVTGISGSGWDRLDYLTIKYNSVGESLWIARYNGSGNGVDYASAIAVDASGNVYVTGSSEGLGTSDDYATIKYDSSGVEQWVVRYNGSRNVVDAASDIAVDAIGNVYVTGYSGEVGTSDDYTTIKYNSSGEEQWAMHYNGPTNSSDKATALSIDALGNIYVTGNSESATWYDIATVKYNSLGIEEWVVRYNGFANLNDEATAIAVDASGGVYVAGMIYEEAYHGNYITIKYDATGVLQWTKIFRSSNRYSYIDNSAVAITVDGAGNIYSTGYIYDGVAARDYLTVKYSSAGTVLWSVKYNGPENSYDVAHDIAVDISGNVYVTGTGYSSTTGVDYVTVKYNSLGVQQWMSRYTGTGNNDDTPASIVVDASGNVCVTGYSLGSETGYDYATIKYSTTGIKQWSNTVNFVINTFTLAVNATNGIVTKNPDQATYEQGTVVMMTQTADRGYDFTGWSGDTTGTDNPISVTMDRDKIINATYSINSTYVQQYRSATSESWALAKDTKGKFKSLPRKPDKNFFKFNLIADSTGVLSLDFGATAKGAITRGKLKVDTLSIFTNVKKLKDTLSVTRGETLQVDGIATIGKVLKVKYAWGQKGKPTLVSSYKLNQPGLPMPNYHNVGEEVFAQGAFPNGLVVGIPQGTKGANSVLHKKYADVQKSLVKIIKKIPVLHSDTLSARCLDSLDGTKKKPIATQQKSLPPDKHNNRLFAEALALELNIAASAREKFPIGLGELTFEDTVANPFNGQPVSTISAMADSMLSCLSLASISGETYDDLYSAIRMINQAFSDTLVDTLSFASKTKLTGVKRLLDVYYLHVTPGLEPISLVSFNEQLSEEPEGFALYQNYPNPFNPTTNFGFRIANFGSVTLKVFNLLGQEVATLLNNETMDEGEYEIPFDASTLPSGVYYYRLNVETLDDDGLAENMTSVKKMILLR